MPDSPQVSVAARLKNVRIDSAAIVAHQQTQLAWRIFELDFDMLRARVAECVDQCLSANPIHIVAEQRVQGPSRSVNNDSKSDFLADLSVCGKFLLHQRERLFEIERWAARRAQSSQGIPAFINHLPHQ